MTNSKPEFITRQLAKTTKSVSITATAVVPALIEAAGGRAKKRFVEFFTASIANDNTRQAYFRAVRRFCSWCEEQQTTLELVEPTHVAMYREDLDQVYAPASVKQHLAAVRMLFDYLTTGGIVEQNPALSVRGPKLVVNKGKTPVLSAEAARELLDSIDVSKMAGLRDRALIALMVFTFARVGAAVAMNIGDVFHNNRRYWIRLAEKGGKYHEMPLQHSAEEYLLAYIEEVGFGSNKKKPLFQTLTRQRVLSGDRLTRNDAYRMVQRRARQAGMSGDVCNHSMRATGITEYMRNGGTLEKAQQMAGHASAKTTNMYNRVNDEMTLDEVERILI